MRSSNEAYLRLAGSKGWVDRQHFFRASALIMRRLMINEARNRKRLKRGGGVAAITLEEELLGRGEKAVEILALNRALERLSEEDPRKGQIVELHFFAGLNPVEIAEMLKVSQRTVQRELRFSKSWLARQLR